MRFWVLFVLVAIAGCSGEHSGDVPSARDYLPMHKGSWFLYSVDSVIYNQGDSVQYHYNLRVSVTDSFPDSNGELTWVLQRSKRNSDNDPWTGMTTWSARVSSYQAVVNEGNTPFVKLIAPLSDGSVWNGNQFNAIAGKEKCLSGTAYTCDLYKAYGVGNDFVSGDKTYHQTATVEQSRETSDFIVARDVRTEVYARNTGLVFRQILHFDYCQAEDCAGQQIVDSGINYRQRLTDYGGF